MKVQKLFIVGLSLVAANTAFAKELAPTDHIRCTAMVVDATNTAPITDPVVFELKPNETKKTISKKLGIVKFDSRWSTAKVTYALTPVDQPSVYSKKAIEKIEALEGQDITFELERNDESADREAGMGLGVQTATGSSGVSLGADWYGSNSYTVLPLYLGAEKHPEDVRVVLVVSCSAKKSDRAKNRNVSELNLRAADGSSKSSSISDVAVGESQISSGVLLK